MGNSWTAALEGPGEADATFVYEGQTLTLWADTDGKWTGSAKSRIDVSYNVSFVGDDGQEKNVSCTVPQQGGTTVCGSSTHILGANNANCEIKLDCGVPSLPNGAVKMHVVGRTGTNVVSVRKMSLNVRVD